MQHTQPVSSLRQWLWLDLRIKQRSSRLSVATISQNGGWHDCVAPEARVLNLMLAFGGQTPDGRIHHPAIFSDGDQPTLLAVSQSYSGWHQPVPQCRPLGCGAWGCPIGKRSLVGNRAPCATKGLSRSCSVAVVPRSSLISVVALCSSWQAFYSGWCRASSYLIP